MADTVPPVQLDNFIDILCKELQKEHSLSMKGILADINTGAIEKKLKEPGVRDIITLGLKAGLLTKKMGIPLFTDDGIRLCNIYKEKGKGQELWSYLHRCLQRINVYREYINYLNEPQKEKEAKEFKEKKTTAKSMFRWLRRMGMLNEYPIDGSVQYVPIDVREQVKKEEFLNALKETYEVNAKEAGPMWKGTFITIQQLREGACQRIKIDYDKFDEFLRQALVGSSKSDIKMRLAKGPGTAYSLRSISPFEFKGEKFLYIALNEVQNG